jgi:hypothetical protein
MLLVAAGCGRSGLKNFEGEGSGQPDGGIDVNVDSGKDQNIDRRPPTPVSVIVTPSSADLTIGGSTMFKATVNFSDGSSADVTSTAIWTTGDSAVASVAAGLVRGLRTGATYVAATASSITGMAKVSVNPGVSLVSIAINPSGAMVPVGATVSFTVTGTYSDGSRADVTASTKFSLDRTDLAALIGSGNQLIARAPGIATVTATNGAFVQKATVSIFQMGQIVQLAVIPGMTATPVGSTVGFRAVATLADGSQQDVTASASWLSGNNAVALVKGQGLVFAAAAGRTTITASYSGFTAVANLVVNGVQLLAVQVSPVDPRLGVGVSVNFTATGVYADGSTADVTSAVTWASSSPAVLRISASGMAATGAVGTSVVTATLNGVQGSSTVTVTSVVLRAITVQPGSVSLTLGGSALLRAVGTYSDGSTVDLTASVAWSASPDNVVSVPDATGLIRAFGVGATVVTATFGGVSGAAKVSVSPATLTGITIDPSVSTVPVGAVEPLAATGFFSDGTSRDVTNEVTWSSSADTTATVSNVMGSAGLVTGVSAGDVTILATATSGAQAKALVSVLAATLQSITVAPANATIIVGARGAYTATGTFSDRTTADLTAQVTWTTGNPNIASISNTGTPGVLLAVAPGITSVTAALGAVSGSTSVTVMGRVVTSVVVSPPGASTPLGVAVQFTAVASFSDGTQQDVTTQATWASTNPRVATVDAAGHATPVAQGGTAIQATFMGVTGAAMLGVTPPVVRTLVVTPSALTLPVMFSAQLTATAVLSDGTTRDVTTTAVWSSDAPMTVSVSARGQVTAVSAGSTTIHATFMNAAGSAMVTVSP